MRFVDRICFLLAVPVGLLLLVLGAFGAFVGCSANFTLPPVLGVAPALVGWGIVRGAWLGWRSTRHREPRALEHVFE
jgi:hypothetical protein